MNLRLILILLVAAGALAGVAAYQMIRWADAPVLPASAHPPAKIIVIAEGSTFHQVAALLEREQLIRSRLFFVWLGKSHDAERRIHPGEYELHAAMPPSDMLAKFLSGRVVLHPVTIPEGFSIALIADVLAQLQITDRTEFMRVAKDPEFAKALGLPAATLEGYLYPDTYKFPRPSAAKDVARAMVGRFAQVFTPEWRTRAEQLGMTVHEIVTLASVIEKETGVREERPQISSVFHNRLKKRIPLQSDPTVIYGLTDFDGNLHKKDLSHPSPYNTYRWTGLPPGPIASPGSQSLHAALFPADSSYLYFVSRNDGTHHFSATLIEHNKAVEKYQKRPFRRSGHSHVDGSPLLPAGGKELGVS
jgi:UPF0755 protein